jgi:hypothetical protein
MGPTIPLPLKAEHDDLHAELRDAIGVGGRTAEAARAVATLLHPHFVKEEAYALPPLGLLARFTRGEAASDPAEAEAALAMVDRLKTELPGMLAEHRAILAALDVLAQAAEAEGQTEQARFARKLAQHARTEEEVLYPATLLVGEHLRHGGARHAAA